MCLSFRDDKYAAAVASNEAEAEKERISRKAKYDKELQEMIKEVDTDKDGSVTFDELAASTYQWPCNTLGEIVVGIVTPFACEIYNWDECLYAYVDPSTDTEKGSNVTPHKKN